MKLKQLINGGALAAAVLTLGSAQAEEKDSYDGLVFCKVQVTKVNEADLSAISVTLPYTGTGLGGRQYTHWNLGKVPAGGVVDSWHGEGGPGKFEAHNDGDVGAYVYLTSAADGNYRGNSWMMENGRNINGRTYYGPRAQWSAGQLEQNFAGDYQEAFHEIFGDVDYNFMMPAQSLKMWQRDTRFYRLAFTRDMDGKLPTWHMLNRGYTERETSAGGSTYECAWEVNDDQPYPCVGAYMGYLPAGEYMPFDVKFWAPRQSSSQNGFGFTFRVEAASFPLWEHDVDVQ